jgi:hypothetical protein
MDVDMNTNIMKYDTNTRWVTHNLSQQKVGNLRLFEKKVIHTQFQKESNF